MDIRYIDAHCHIQFEQYDEDREELVEEMRREGIAAIVVGCDYASSQKAVALAEKHEHLFAAVGIHPTDTDELFDKDTFRVLAKHPKVVAIGECGLDFFRSGAVDAQEKKRQIMLCGEHIELAAELSKPRIIHARPSKGTMDAYHEIAPLLQKAKQRYPSLRGDMHFFVGGVREAVLFTNLEFTLSFTAVLTFARDYDEVIRRMPLESLLAETDSPYVAPQGRRGKRNDPLSVVDVALKIAELRAEDPDIVRRTLLGTTGKLFRLGYD